MNRDLDTILETIGREFETTILRGSRHYMEVNIGERARRLGFADLSDRYKHTAAIIPLKTPRSGMKVRIDGRTFVGYAEYEPGFAVPGYLARESGRPYKTFIPNDSMICNFA